MKEKDRSKLSERTVLILEHLLKEYPAVKAELCGLLESLVNGESRLDIESIDDEDLRDYIRKLLLSLELKEKSRYYFKMSSHKSDRKDCVKAMKRVIEFLQQEYDRQSNVEDVIGHMGTETNPVEQENVKEPVRRVLGPTFPPPEATTSQNHESSSDDDEYGPQSCSIQNDVDSAWNTVKAGDGVLPIGYEARDDPPIASAKVPESSVTTAVVSQRDEWMVDAGDFDLITGPIDGSPPLFSVSCICRQIAEQHESCERIEEQEIPIRKNCEENRGDHGTFERRAQEGIRTD